MFDHFGTLCIKGLIQLKKLSLIAYTKLRNSQDSISMNSAVTVVSVNLWSKCEFTKENMKNYKDLVKN